MTYLKSVSNKNNLFKKQSHESDSVILDKDNFNDSDDFELFYEIKKLLVKKTQIIWEKKKIEYFVKWFNWKSEHDQWYNINKLQKAKKSIKNYKKKFSNSTQKFLNSNWKIIQNLNVEINFKKFNHLFWLFIIFLYLIAWYFHDCITCYSSHHFFVYIFV